MMAMAVCWHRCGAARLVLRIGKPGLAYGCVTGNGLMAIGTRFGIAAPLLGGLMIRFDGRRSAF